MTRAKLTFLAALACAALLAPPAHAALPQLSGAVDLANARLNVAESKTDAGRRTVDVTPWLLDELKAHKAASRYSAPDELVFCTGNGTPFNRSNVRRYSAGGSAVPPGRS